MMLKNKAAVIYGAGGAVGSAVARALRAKGPSFFLPGARRSCRQGCRFRRIRRGVDALDEQTVERQLQSVIDKAGRVDVSFNAIGIPKGAGCVAAGDFGPARPRADRDVSPAW
jgi:NAD(P)-dependent dehydrogenase (short-subunit alcohol dehydrogenase family)